MLVRNRVLFELVVLVPFSEVELSQKPQGRQQLESPISGCQTDIRATLQQLRMQFFCRKMVAVRLFAKNFQNRFALCRDTKPALAQTLEDRIGFGALTFVQQRLFFSTVLAQG